MNFSKNLSLMFCFIWLFLGWMNAINLALEYIPIACVACIMDMLFSRLDYYRYLNLKTGNVTNKIYNRTMNFFSIIAGAGAGIFMVITVYDICVNGIRLFMIVPILLFGFLAVCMYILTAKSRENDTRSL